MRRVNKDSKQLDNKNKEVKKLKSKNNEDAKNNEHVMIKNQEWTNRKSRAMPQ